MNNKREIRMLILKRLVHKSNQVIDDISKLTIQLQKRQAYPYLHFKKNNLFAAHHSSQEEKNS